MATVKDKAYGLMASVAARTGLVLEGRTMRQPRIKSLCKMKLVKAYNSAAKAVKTGRKADLTRAQRQWSSAQRCMRGTPR